VELRESQSQTAHQELQQDISTPKGCVPQVTIMVDPKDWGVALENPELNTTGCCRVCNIEEDIARAEKWIGTTGLGQVCACQWKDRVYPLGFSQRTRKQIR
jgi:hypothetical protein